jgi:hypothetical protein
MYLVLAQLFALFHFASSVSIPQNRRDVLKSSGTARFEARHVRGHNDIERRGTIETVEPAVSDSNGDLYSCTVGVGDQSFTLQFDSGSTDFWISGALYQPNADSAKSTDATWSATYGEGQAQGVVYTDTVTFGSITLPNQPVEVAREEASMFSSPGFDGILGLGLGPNHVSQANVPTFRESVYDLLELPLFTAKLTRPNENVGFYTFGYIDASTLGGRTPQYTPVKTTGDSAIYWWSFPSANSEIGGQSVPGLPADNIAIADTGTSLIYVNDDLVNAIYTALRGGCETTGLGDTPCIFPQNADIPSITLYIGEYPVTLDSQDIIVGPAGEGYEDYYVGSVQPRTYINSPVDVFGDRFLRNIYAIFDFTNGDEKFGFVTRAKDT